MDVRSVFCAVILCPAIAGAATLDVGPGQPFATPCAAIAVAADNDTIRIDAAGSYNGDVCAWSRNGLTLIGVNGRPRIDAAGRNAQGKAIWVISGNDTVIDNIELSGAAVPDRNGAGIRQEGRNLTVRNAYFHHTENGILTNATTGSTITIEYSEFAHNGFGDSYSHNLYIGKIDRLIFRHNWSHHATVGHLLKSRANENHILYNRLSGEAGGRSSYEINLPNGGLSYVIGNVVEQSSSTENGGMLDYLSEGSPNPDRRLFVINNTFVNNRGSGTFLQIAAAGSQAVVRNNIFFGGGTVSTQAAALLENNLVAINPQFVNAAQLDFRLMPSSPAINAGVSPGSDGDQSLAPHSEYRHLASVAARNSDGSIDIGAFEFVGDAVFADGFDGTP